MALAGGKLAGRLLAGRLLADMDFGALRRLRRTGGTVASLGAVGVALGTGLLPLTCPFKFVTGLNCPFCGGSRMIGALLHADLAAAWHLNAFAFVVVPPAVLLLVVAMARQELGRISRT